jgi:hypothetical protein
MKILVIRGHVVRSRSPWVSNLKMEEKLSPSYLLSLVFYEARVKPPA